jgi:hypothetical protein
VGARFDQPENLLGRYDCEEIRERRSCNRRQEEMAAWLEEVRVKGLERKKRGYRVRSLP